MMVTLKLSAIKMQEKIAYSGFWRQQFLRLFLRILFPLFLFLPLFLMMSCSPPQYDDRVRETYSSGEPKLIHRYENGEWVETLRFHFNGIRHTEMEVHKGIPHGKYLEWNSKGQLQWEGQYEMGKKTETWTRWLKERIMLEKGDFMQGRKEGHWTEYYADGELRAEKAFTAGDSSGIWTFYFPSGKPERILSCFPQNDEGVRLELSPRGDTLEALECRRGKPHGAYVRKDNLGRTIAEGQYRDSLKFGTWKFFYRTGELRKVQNWKQGLRDGLQIRLQPNGDTLAQAVFENGSGRWQLPCLQKPELICADSSWKHGALHGKIITLRPNKNIRIEQEWSEGQLTLSRTWKNNTLSSFGQYRNGKKNGSWKVWNAEGILLQDLTYRNDSLFGVQRYYDSTGTLTMEKNHLGPGRQTYVKIIQP